MRLSSFADKSFSSFQRIAHESLMKVRTSCYCRDRMCIVEHVYTHGNGTPMRTNIEIDDALMKEAQKASGHATKKKTVEEALRLMVKLRRQADVRKGFGKIPWRGDLAQSRRGRGVG